MFVGAMTALVTPMRDGKIDEGALEKLVEAQIAGGIDALVPCGTTGESATLSPQEQARVIGRVVATARGRVPIIAGAGSNSTAHAVELARAAKAEKVDGLLLVTPYYNRPPQEGLVQHFRAIIEATHLPTVLYNVPSRTGCDLQVDTVARMCELPEVVALKEASGQVTRTQQVVAKLGDRLIVLSGEDAINYPLYAIGARGCISVVSNIAPKIVSEGWDAHAAGDATRARALHATTVELADVLFSESSPIPTKTALAMMGRMSDELRLPLIAMSDPGRQRLRHVLTKHALL